MSPMWPRNVIKKELQHGTALRCRHFISVAREFPVYK
jgi:hypothetical protein